MDEQLDLPGIGAGVPGTVGGWVGPVARETSAARFDDGAKSMVRVYAVITVVFTGASGDPIALL